MPKEYGVWEREYLTRMMVAILTPRYASGFSENAKVAALADIAVAYSYLSAVTGSSLAAFTAG